MVVTVPCSAVYDRVFFAFSNRFNILKGVANFFKVKLYLKNIENSIFNKIYIHNTEVYKSTK